MSDYIDPKETNQTDEFEIHLSETIELLHTKRLSKLKDKLVAAEQSIQELKQQNDSLRELREQNERMKERYERDRLTISSLEAIVANVENEKASLASRLDYAGDQVQSLLAALKEKETALADALLQLDEARKARPAVLSDDANQKEIERLKSLLEKAVEDRLKAESALAEAANERDNLLIVLSESPVFTELNHAEIADISEIQKLYAQIEDLDRRLSDEMRSSEYLSALIAKKDENLALANSKLTSSLQKIAQLERMLEEGLAKGNDEATEMSVTIERLEEETKGLAAIIQAQNQQQSDIRQENERLVSELAAAVKKLNDIEAKHLAEIELVNAQWAIWKPYLEAFQMSPLKLEEMILEKERLEQRVLDLEKTYEQIDEVARETHQNAYDKAFSDTWRDERRSLLTAIDQLQSSVFALSSENKALKEERNRPQPSKADELAEVIKDREKKIDALMSKQDDLIKCINRMQETVSNLEYRLVKTEINLALTKAEEEAAKARGKLFDPGKK